MAVIAVMKADRAAQRGRTLSQFGLLGAAHSVILSRIGRAVVVDIDKGADIDKVSVFTF